MELVEVSNVEDACIALSNTSEEVTVVNPPGSIRYLGMLAIHCMIKQLQQRFCNISNVVVNVDDDHAGFFSAISLGYRKIVYTGTSSTIINIAKSYSIQLLPSTSSII